MHAFPPSMAKKRKSGPRSSTTTMHTSAAATRKARRKEERRAKKMRRAATTTTVAAAAAHRTGHAVRDDDAAAADERRPFELDDENENNEAPHAIFSREARRNNKKEGRRQRRSNDKKKQTKKQQRRDDDDENDDPYGRYDADTAAALRADDAEIADLERKLGLDDGGGGGDKKKSKRKLHKEYAKLEGYGEDFGDFLDDLDGLAERLVSDKQPQSDCVGEGDYGRGDDDEEDGDFDDDSVDPAENEDQDAADDVPSSSGEEEQDDELSHEKDVDVPSKGKKKRKGETYVDAKSKRKRRDENDDEDEDGNEDNGVEGDPYGRYDAETAAALRADDAEIAALERKLGITSDRKSKRKLHKEYAKLEGYGEDFGDFLDDLDDLTRRVTAAGDDSSRRRREYDDDDDEEGCGGEAGWRSRAQENGDDDDDDNSMPSEEEGERIVPMKEPASDEDESDMDEDDVHSLESSSDVNDDEGGHDADKDGRLDRNDDGGRSDDDDGSAASSSSSSASGDESDNDDEKEEPDHAPEDTYRPTAGEDIYGNKVDDALSSRSQPARYVPPHLRKKREADGGDGNANKDGDAAPDGGSHRSQRPPSSSSNDPDHAENLRTIQRSLNNALNRLSDDTLESVAKSIVALYQSHPTHDVHDCLWKTVRSVCLPSHMVMSGLIPLYVACAAGVHFRTGEDVQLGGYLLEQIVTVLWNDLRRVRERICDEKDEGDMQRHDDDEGNDPVINKETSNAILILCYLYNYGVVHCTLVYDVVRDLIRHFTELDVELLLLSLSHCGYQLRSDDPTALKDIVLSVQNRAVEAMDDKKDGGKSSSAASVAVANSSRVQYMVSAMIDLKNNKKRKKDAAVGEKTSRYRKVVGRMKSTASSHHGVRRSSERITLNDILDIEAKGRWWKVGASWLGNQFHQSENESDRKNTDKPGKDAASLMGARRLVAKEEDDLLALASRQRMNTDTRRSIFCIIMGSMDRDDAFEKLVKAGMLKSMAERDTVRVLVDCCGQEKSYNPYYAHLATRMCEFQPKCRFTLQLAYWDLFKQFAAMKARTAASLAKLLAHLIGIGRCLSLSLLKVIDMSPDNLPETGAIFLTVFFTTLFESALDKDQIADLFAHGIPRGDKGGKLIGSEEVTNEKESDSGDGDGDVLRENISVFCLHYLKSSPKNAKGSRFRANFKAALKACETDGLDSMVEVGKRRT